MFRQLFVLLPNLVAEPSRSASSDDTVFIESECGGTFGQRTFHFTVCDRFVIEEGIIISRCSFFSPTSVAFVLLRHPASCLV